jgi:LPXTG-motif cell wall-anchored protein
LIRSGNATAIGSDTVVLICQAFRDDAACAPKVDPPVDNPDPDTPAPTTPDTAQVLFVTLTPTTPAAAPAAPAAPAITVAGEDEALASAADSLPFTGTETTTLVGIGGVMVGMGTALSRRRRQQRI